MTAKKQFKDLQINEDMEFQQREWRVQSWAWLAGALLMGSALLGLFGSGPLSGAEARDAEGRLWIEYERFERYAAPTELRVHIKPAPGADGKARLWLSRDYLDSFRIEHVLPEPESVEAAGDRLVYVFDTVSADGTAITFQVQPETIGRVRGLVGLDNGAPVQFAQLIYP
jgi:hypothetical protein